MFIIQHHKGIDSWACCRHVYQWGLSHSVFIVYSSSSSRSHLTPSSEECFHRREASVCVVCYFPARPGVWQTTCGPRGTDYVSGNTVLSMPHRPDKYTAISFTNWGMRHPGWQSACLTDGGTSAGHGMRRQSSCTVICQYLFLVKQPVNTGRVLSKGLQSAQFSRQETVSGFGMSRESSSHLPFIWRQSLMWIQTIVWR